MESNINNMTEMSKTSTSFSAIASNDAQILILGSMPGVESLKKQRYYAHPRNTFWPIILSLFNIAEDLSYQQRCANLVEQKVALWDVLQSCQRQGSLDSNIEAESIIANDFSNFLDQHQAIKLIAFNGAKAEQIFNQYVLPSLSENQLTITRKRLPSTSPAHAAMTFEQKCLCWRETLIG